MSRLLPLFAAAAVLPAALSAAAPTATPLPAGTLTIEVGNLRNAHGRVHVDLCDQGHFLRDNCPVSAAVPARSPMTTIVLHDVPPGHYAAQLFHDENANDKADRGLFGLPKEGIAFSRDAPIRLSPPHWNDAVIDVRPGTQETRVKMRYFMGAPGPAAH